MLGGRSTQNRHFGFLLEAGHRGGGDGVSVTSLENSHADLAALSAGVESAVGTTAVFDAPL